MAGLSRMQEMILAIVPKCTACLGMPCSLFLMYDICKDYRKKGTTSVQRILLGMSTIDFLSSSGWFLSTWAVPRGSFALSAGTQATCSYQGFLLQLAIGAPLYNSSLALFYLLMIKYNWTENMLRGIERWVHFGVLTFSIGTAVVLLPLKQYNHIGAVCWIIGDPVDCGDSSFQGGGEPCERGNNAWLYGLFLFYGVLWVCIVLCLVSMCLVFLSVRSTVRRVRRYSLARRSIASSGLSSETQVIALASIYYSLSFFITWTPSTLWSISTWFQFSAYWLDILSATCEPMQGFWNLMIYARNRRETRRQLRNLMSCITCNFVKRDDFDDEVRFLWGVRSTMQRTRSMGIGSLRKSLESNIADESSLALHRGRSIPQIVLTSPRAPEAHSDIHDEFTNEGLENKLGAAGNAETSVSQSLDTVPEANSPDVAVGNQSAGTVTVELDSGKDGMHDSAPQELAAHVKSTLRNDLAEPISHSPNPIVDEVPSQKAMESSMLEMPSGPSLHSHPLVRHNSAPVPSTLDADEQPSYRRQTSLSTFRVQESDSEVGGVFREPLPVSDFSSTQESVTSSPAVPPEFPSEYEETFRNEW